MTLVNCLWSLCPLFSLFIHAFFFLRNYKLNLRRLGGSKGWSLVFAKSSSEELRTGNTIKFNVSAFYWAQIQTALPLSSKDVQKPIVHKETEFYFISSHYKQFILISETLVGLDIPLCRIKTSRKPWWVFWLHPQPMHAFLTGSLQTRALTKAAGERFLLAN